MLLDAVHIDSLFNSAENQFFVDKNRVSMIVVISSIIHCYL